MGVLRIKDRLHYDGLTSVERSRRKSKRKHQQLRKEVLTHYGNGVCSCVRCGYTDMKALSIDHIKGNGNYLKTTKKEPRGQAFYKWLRERNYPKEFQTLCMNCQFIKRADNNENSVTTKDRLMRRGLY